MTGKPNITRRDFATGMSSILAGSLFTHTAVSQEALLTRRIPQTGEMLPAVGLGSSKAVMQIPESGTGAIASVIDRLIALGGRVIDTSPRTVEVDSEFGRVLRAPQRESLFVATKINDASMERGRAQFEQNRTLYGRSVLDLAQVESLRGLDVHWPDLRSWKEGGAVRYIGVTVSSYELYEQLERFMRTETPDFIHVNYSVMETRAEERLLPLAQDLGMGVLTNRPFMNGAYFPRVAGHELPPWAQEFDCESWAQFSVKYALSHPAVTCCLTETTNPSHMEDNVRGGHGRLPDERTKQRMREYVSNM